MEIVAIATLVVGFALGLRFRVIILIPAVFVAVALVTAVAIVQEAPVGFVAVLNIVGATCLQFGYLGGTVFASKTVPGHFGDVTKHRSVH